ncbi:FAD-dependent oxidoreductase [Jongsikchunia kroppenstedtii]|uniref:FAD-dependent oxidoreductase n=1 Tax=Jongsikchunia kroppenstedtii TaxID=1121721 RepID=UPI0005B93BE8|nr:FAD-dependent oxidoreductase [Jongsikchunia kroppenstedtii]
MPAKEGVLRVHVAVVGGGVIGLSCALALSESGRRVTVFDDATGDPMPPASSVAGGMLAAVGEARTGEDALWSLLRRGADAWDRQLRRLGSEVVTADDTVLVGTDTADIEHLGTVADWVAERSGTLEVVGAAAARRLVPGAGPRIRGGVVVKGERAVDNSLVIDALRRCLEEAAVPIVRRRVDDLGAVDADRVVLAAGCGSEALWPGLGIHPVKGEVLRLSRGRYALPPPTCVVRALVNGRPVYLVPRADGVVVGATSYDGDAGDPQPQVGGVVDLLTDAMTVLPGLREYRLAGIQAGFRPGTADGLPLIGALDDRVVAATGHGRNGFALAALTGELIRELFDGAEAAPELDPRRRYQGGTA